MGRSQIERELGEGRGREGERGFPATMSVARGAEREAKHERARRCNHHHRLSGLIRAEDRRPRRLALPRSLPHRSLEPGERQKARCLGRADLQLRRACEHSVGEPQVVAGGDERRPAFE
jgi:hypothetical protein